MLRIKKLCRERGITQAELAGMIGVSPSALNQSISGNPTLERLNEIADALDVNVTELFEEKRDASLLVEYKGEVRRLEQKDLDKLFGDESK